MMRSVALRLTLIYLAIIMALSIGFSAVIYRLSYRQLTHSLPPEGFARFVDPANISDFAELRQQNLEESEEALRTNLVLLNLATLALGAVVSYGLARRTLRPIEEAFEAQGRFTADASHELRTPLTAMQTSVEVGLRNPKLTLPQAKDLLVGTLEEVKKLSSLSNGLLKLTRNNGHDIPKSRVHIRKAVEAAISQLQLAAQNKNISIDDQLSSKYTVLGDDISLKELFVILLDNAIKYSVEGTSVTISGQTQGHSVSIEVSDHGMGMKATDMLHIFDRFYRADQSRSRDRVEGYGLGLPIAKKIVEAHSGAIDVRSKLGEGSTFTVKLPLVNKD